MQHITISEILQRMKDRSGFRCHYFIDVGANRGDVSCNVHDIFPRVIGGMIEPHPKLHPHLEKLAAERDFTLFKAACGGKVGKTKLRFSSRDTGLCGTTIVARPDDPVAQDWFDEEVEVRVETLDNLYLCGAINIPEFLKIDAEGMELEILGAAKNLLGKTQLIMLETTLYPSLIEHPTFADTVAFMDAHGYQLYDIPTVANGYREHDGTLMILDVMFALKTSPLVAYPYWS